jgi:hypothetical protein
VPLSAVEAVDSQKVILNCRKLERRLRESIGHVHNAETPNLRPVRALLFNPSRYDFGGAVPLTRDEQFSRRERFNQLKKGEQNHKCSRVYHRHERNSSQGPATFERRRGDATRSSARHEPKLKRTAPKHLMQRLHYRRGTKIRSKRV